MVPTSFDYVHAQSVQDAVSLLAQHGPEAKLLAGGHSLIPAMKLRLNSPSTLIDVTGIDGLSAINLVDDKIEIGALATHRAVETSDVVKNHCVALAEAATRIGDAQVRNRGTIGGSLAHADPAADYPALVLALGAEITVEGKSGSRTIPADDFFTGLFETALAADELITKVSFPTIDGGSGAAYEKFANPASRFAVVGVAVMVKVDSSGNCTAARVGVTGAAASAFRAHNVENALTDTALNDQSITDATAKVADPANMLSDLSGSAAYRAHLCSVLARRALLKATEQAS
ncbi:xanthine dehydrogenase family protein subunit M [bacterium]|nr:xanthine dehydrogenase family protein subunit M [bacterium]